MHLAATNVCIWFRFLVFEVVEGLHHGLHEYVHHEDGLYNDSVCKYITVIVLQ